MSAKDTSEALWDAAYEAIQNRVDAIRGEDSSVIYSAYDTDENDVPIDNLDEVAATGRVRFIQATEEFWGGPNGRDYVSDVVENPTWLDLCKLADEMIITTNDRHHVFLEGMTEVGAMDHPEGPITLFKFVMGS